eukprot:1737740-Amphidinium_carterae.1
MLSGRSTVVAADEEWNEESVLYVCRERLGLADDGATLELCHGSDWVPADGTEVQDWPGIQPKGEIS